MRICAAILLFSIMASPLTGQPASGDYSQLKGKLLELRTEMMPIAYAGGVDGTLALDIAIAAERLDAQTERLRLATVMFERFACREDPLARAEATFFLAGEVEQVAQQLEQKNLAIRMIERDAGTRRMRRAAERLEAIRREAVEILRR